MSRCLECDCELVRDYKCRHKCSSCSDMDPVLTEGDTKSSLKRYKPITPPPVRPPSGPRKDYK